MPFLLTEHQPVDQDADARQINRVAYNPRDHYFHKAKAQNFVARSVFKLEEIDQRLKLVRLGQRVLDLGASPGSWTQYVLKKVGSGGAVYAMDLSELKVQDPRLKFLQADAFVEENLKQLLGDEKVDLVLSDMAPKTTGIRVTDQARSFELCQRALAVAQLVLKPRGHLVIKFFHSEDFQNLKKALLQNFEQVEAIRPDSTRSMSKEIFLIGLRKK